MKRSRGYDFQHALPRDSATVTGRDSGRKRKGKASKQARSASGQAQLRKGLSMGKVKVGLLSAGSPK
jgi:hypothetical protein